MNNRRKLQESYSRYMEDMTSGNSEDQIIEGKKRSKKTLSDSLIFLNVKRSMTRLMQSTRVNHFLFVFSDYIDKIVSLHRNGRTYKLRFTKGNRDFGACKISRVHLLDGGCAYSGCFSLFELNRDLKSILANGNITIKGQTMELTFTNQDGLKWWIIAFKSGNEWIVNSIHTTRNQSTTRKMQQMTLHQLQGK